MEKFIRCENGHYFAEYSLRICRLKDHEKYVERKCRGCKDCIEGKTNRIKKGMMKMLDSTLDKRI